MAGGRSWILGFVTFEDLNSCEFSYHSLRPLGLDVGGAVGGRGSGVAAGAAGFERVTGDETDGAAEYFFEQVDFAFCGPEVDVGIALGQDQ